MRGMRSSIEGGEGTHEGCIEGGERTHEDDGDEDA